MVVVTIGVILTTLSASSGKSSSSKSDSQTEAVDHTSIYVQGIGILTLALVLSGLLGIVQDRTNAALAKRQAASKAPAEKGQPAAWEESMFYLHFLSLPVFFTTRHDLYAQMKVFLASPTVELMPSPVLSALSSNSLFKGLRMSTIGDTCLRVPSSIIILAANTFTVLFCIAGVNRLTSRVSSLTVTLILVVRKAVSLIISEMLGDVLGRPIMDERGRLLMWLGAILVFAGTIGYTVGGSQAKKASVKKTE